MIPLSRPDVGEKELKAVGEVFKVGYFGMGSETAKFEQELKTYLNSDLEIACVNNGTCALLLSVIGCGLHPGDEVLVPTITFVASYQAISGAGCVPVSCDVDKNTALINLEDAKKRNTSKTKAIMPVHFASHIGDIEKVYEFARENNLRVIEDAAHSFGCRYDNKLIGTFGDVVCFSFDSIKNITCGEGGAILSKDKNLISYIKKARILGIEKNSTDKYDFDTNMQGFRFHMSDINAAIGRIQLTRFESEFIPYRKNLWTLYREKLSGVKNISLFELNPKEEVVPHIISIKILNGLRDKVRQNLTEIGAETALHYKPNHLLTKYRAYDFPNAEKIYSQMLTLPLNLKVTPEQVDKVCEVIRKTVT